MQHQGAIQLVICVKMVRETISLALIFLSFHTSIMQNNHPSTQWPTMLGSKADEPCAAKHKCMYETFLLQANISHVLACGLSNTHIKHRGKPQVLILHTANMNDIQPFILSHNRVGTSMAIGGDQLNRAIYQLDVLIQASYRNDHTPVVRLEATQQKNQGAALAAMH